MQHWQDNLFLDFLITPETEIYKKKNIVVNDNDKK